MKFSRARLLDAAQRALAADRERHEERVRDWDAFLARDRTKWADDHADDWDAFLDRVRDVLRAGDPVRRFGVGDTPPMWAEPYRDDAGRSKPNRDYAGPPELRQLLAVLDLVTEDEVTTAGLHALGITGSTMQTVARHLVAPEGAAA